MPARSFDSNMSLSSVISSASEKSYVATVGSNGLARAPEKLSEKERQENDEEVEDSSQEMPVNMSLIDKRKSLTVIQEKKS